MKNLIYSICDNNYSALLPYWYNSIKKFNDCDILIICPEHNFSTDLNVHLQRETIFDYRYVSKFVINNFSNIDQYDNFLFLDLDIICNANLDKLFETINNSDIVHGVKEKECLIKSDHFHKFDDLSSYNINDSDIAYNAGTFGFNKNLRKIFINFIDFINQNKNQYCDQPIFNVYFNHYKLIQPTLSEFVFLENYNININPIDKCKLVHFLGNYGNIYNKITRIKNYVKN